MVLLLYTDPIILINQKPVFGSLVMVRQVVVLLLESSDDTIIGINCISTCTPSSGTLPIKTSCSPRLNSKLIPILNYIFATKYILNVTDIAIIA